MRNVYINSGTDRVSNKQTYNERSELDSIGIFGATNVPERLERWAQKLAITVENSERAVNALFAGLAELFDTRLRIVTCDASRKTHFVIPTSMKRCRLAKQHSVNAHASSVTPKMPYVLSVCVPDTHPDRSTPVFCSVHSIHIYWYARHTLTAGRVVLSVLHRVD